MPTQIRRTNRRSPVRGTLYLVIIAAIVLAAGTVIAAVMRLLVG